MAKKRAAVAASTTRARRPATSRQSAGRGASASAGRQVALLRGINVGKAKRIAMADLRQVVEGLGYRDVKTLLNSGNIVFTAASDLPVKSAARIESAIAKQIGVSSKVTVLSAAEVALLIAENSLVKMAHDHSRLLVAVHMDPAALAPLKPLTKQDWKPDALVVGSRAAYVWCSDGLLESRLAVSMNKLLGPAATTRNWATMLKLHALLQEGAT